MFAITSIFYKLAAFLWTLSSRYFSFGAIISSGRTYLSKSASLMVFNSIALSFRVIPFLCAFLAVFEAASYPDHGLEKYIARESN